LLAYQWTIGNALQNLITYIDSSSNGAHLFRFFNLNQEFKMNHKVIRFSDELQKTYQIVRRVNGDLGLVNKDGRNRLFTKLNSRDGVKLIKRLAKMLGIQLLSRDIEELLSNLEVESDDAIVIVTSLRVYRSDSVVEVYLADSESTVARISHNGYELVKSGAEAVFEKNVLMKALPIPSQDGDYKLILPYMNLSETAQLLVLAWLTYTLSHPKAPSTNYVLLFLIGDQGSGKSFLTRLLVSLIDPSAIGTQIFPRKQSDLIAFASQRHMVAYDNMRELTNLLSDLLCVCCTGGAASLRKLYTDADIHDSYIHIAMILNGIHNPITQSDLAQRTLTIEMNAITGKQRVSERELLEQFEGEKHKIFGGLLNLISQILKHLPDSKLIKPERMIEFSQWLAAMENAIDVEAGTLQSAYSETIRQSQVDTLLENTFAAAIVEFANTSKSQWSGTPTELLNQLEYTSSSHAIRSPDWPRTAISLSKRLNSLKASLLSHDIEVTLSRGKERRITILNLDEF